MVSESMAASWNLTARSKNSFSELLDSSTDDLIEIVGSSNALVLLME